MKNPANDLTGFLLFYVETVHAPSLQCYACFLASISRSSILMAESLMTVPGPKMATAPAS